MKKILLKLLGSVFTIFILNMIFNFLFVSKNDSDKYLDIYLKQQQQLKVFAVDKIKISKKLVGIDKLKGEQKTEYIHELMEKAKVISPFSHTSYLKKTIYFKGIMGGSRDYTFKDSLSNKYFKIMRFDQYKQFTRGNQHDEINERELYVMVDSVQYNNPNYGTIENPYTVFSYESVDKKNIKTITLNIEKEDGTYLKKKFPVEPSNEEYRYNALQYLTYIMTKEEFKKRFNVTSIF